MVPKLLRPDEVDKVLRYPHGKCERLARRGKITHITLPDGSIRFDAEEIERLLKPATASITAGGPAR